MESITALTSSVLVVLGQYALKQGTEIVTQVSKEGIILATELLERVRSHFKARAGEKAQKALANYRADPEDYQAVFEKYLKQELETNEAFRQEMTTFLERFQAAVPETEISVVVSGSGAAATQGGVAAGEGGVAVKGDVEGGIHIGKSE
jgi:hypothetical protein